MKTIKTTIVFILLLACASPIQALTVNQEMAKKVVLQYYEKLEQCAQKPENILLHNEIERMFNHGGWVYNDLLELKKNYQGEKESEIKNYLTTMMRLSTTENMKFTISAKIDDSSWEEQKDLSLDDKGSEYNVWVTVEKTVCLLGQKVPLFTNKETIKVREGLIQSIRPSSDGNNEVNFFKLYEEKKYDKAFDILLKRVLDDKADQDTYFYLGLMLRKGQGCKDKYASSVREKLCVYYWYKCENGRRNLMHLGWMGNEPPRYNLAGRMIIPLKEYYLDNTPPYPVKFDLMPVYKEKGDKILFGYMDTKGHMVIPYKYLNAHVFEDNGRALVKFADGSWGYIDTKGNIVEKK